VKRFLWVALVSAALIVVAAVLSESAWSSLGGLPAHPLVVHGIVVLVPLLSLFVLVGLFQARLLAVSYLYITGAYGVLAAAAIGAKKSGEQLAAVVGLPEQHEQLGTILVALSVGLFITFALFALFAFVLEQNALAIVLAVLLGILAGASIPLTILVGHSGAESVWSDAVIAAEESGSAADALEEPAETEPQNTIAPTPPPTNATQQISRDDVAQHSTPEDCWTIVNGEVFDLTPFISRHPGGRSAISQICGRDGTELFSGQHAGQGMPEKELSSHKIGVLAT
jgi:hypothetical protein